MLGNGPDPTMPPSFEGVGDCAIAGPAHETMLLNAEAGFELWSGGRGLAVTHFAVWTPKPPRPPVRHLPKCPAGVRHCPKGGRP